MSSKAFCQAGSFSTTAHARSQRSNSLTASPPHLCPCPVFDVLAPRRKVTTWTLHIPPMFRIGVSFCHPVLGCRCEPFRYSNTRLNGPRYHHAAMAQPLDQPREPFFHRFVNAPARKPLRWRGRMDLCCGTGFCRLQGRLQHLNRPAPQCGGAVEHL